MKISPKFIRLFAFFLASSVLGFLFLALSFSPLFHSELLTQVALSPTSLADDFADFSAAGFPKPEIMHFRNADNDLLTAWYFKKEGATKIAVYCHGAGGNMSWYAPFTNLLLASNASVLLFDPRGYGQSHGKVAFTGLMNDMISAYDFAANKLHVAPENIVLVGQSIGTGAASFASEKRKAGGIILISPYSNMARLASERIPQLGFMPNWFFGDIGIDNRRAFREVHAPLLILGGDADKILPPVHAKELFAEATEPKTLVLIKNGTHNTLAQEDPVHCQKAISDFIKSLP